MDKSSLMLWTDEIAELLDTLQSEYPSMAYIHPDISMERLVATGIHKNIRTHRNHQPDVLLYVIMYTECESKHWSLLVSDLKRKHIYSMDILQLYAKSLKEEAFRQWELLVRKGFGLEFISVEHVASRQLNSYECSYFAIANASKICENLYVEKSQLKVDAKRLKLIHILVKSIRQLKLDGQKIEEQGEEVTKITEELGANEEDTKITEEFGAGSDQHENTAWRLDQNDNETKSANGSTDHCTNKHSTSQSDEKAIGSGCTQQLKDHQTDGNSTHGSTDHGSTDHSPSQLNNMTLRARSRPKEVIK